jgi:hypothetical protein
MGTAIAVHPDGSAYLTGYTITANFPETPGVFQLEDGTTASSTSNFDGFVIACVSPSLLRHMA